MIGFRTLKKSISFIFAMIVLLLAETVLAIVINEIHHNPPDNTVRQEFIEIFNPDEDEVNLGGWRLSGAVNYVFSEDVKFFLAKRLGSGKNNTKIAIANALAPRTTNNHKNLPSVPWRTATSIGAIDAGARARRNLIPKIRDLHELTV